MSARVRRGGPLPGRDRGHYLAAVRAARAVLADPERPRPAARAVLSALDHSDLLGAATTLAVIGMLSVPRGLVGHRTVVEVLDDLEREVEAGRTLAGEVVTPGLPAVSEAPGASTEAGPCPSSPVPAGDGPSAAERGAQDGPPGWGRALSAWRGDGGERLYGESTEEGS